VPNAQGGLPLLAPMSKVAGCMAIRHVLAARWLTFGLLMGLRPSEWRDAVLTRERTNVGEFTLQVEALHHAGVRLK
jgi:hypothetical protein